MKKPEDVAVIVQARLSSQRCTRKMIRPFGDTTLMDLCLTKLVDSSINNKNIYASVYEEELKTLCLKYPVNIFHRSENSAHSEGTPMTDMYEWWDKIPFKYAVLINACAPFMSSTTIENFYNSYCKSESDGMFGIIEKKDYFWDSNNRLLTPLKESVMNTKTADVIKQAAHCLYAGRLDMIGKDIWMGNFNKHNDIQLYSMPENETFDIDHEWQFQLAERMYKNTCL